jgi:hypothetical protein
MAEELARPGVEVIQEFRTVTPSIITPTLVPCVVGVAKQIVEVLADTSSGGQQLNPDALVVMPAFFIAAAATGSPLRYQGLDGLNLVVSINEGADVTLPFSDPTAFGLTPATVVDQVNKTLRALGVTSALAETVGTDSWRLRTVGVGEFQSIYISVSTSPVVASTFGIGRGRTFTGLTSYNQYTVVVPPTSLPDPNGNLDELSVEQDSIRSFLSTGFGPGIRESLRTSSFLRRGSVAVQGATTEGTVDLTSFPTFDGEVIWVQLEAGEVQVVAIPGTVTNAAQLLAHLNGTSGLTGVTASLGGSDGLILTRDVGGYAYFVEILTPDSNSANTLLGITAQVARGTSIAAVDDGNGDALTPLLTFEGANFTASPGSAVLTAAGVPSLPPAADSTLVLSDGGQPQTIVFAGTENSLALVKTAIEAVVGSVAGGSLLVNAAGPTFSISNTRLGDESIVEILGGTALGNLDQGNTPAETTEGTQSLSPDTAAVATEGTVTLVVAQAAAAGETFNAYADGGAAQLVDLGASPADHTDVTTFLAHINGQLTDITASQGPDGGLLLTSDNTGSTASVQVEEVADGVSLLGLTEETVTGADVFPTITTETFQASLDGAAPLTVTFAGETTFAAVKATIEGDLAGVTVTQGVNGGAVLTGTTLGVSGTIELIDDGGGGLALLGLDEAVFAGNGETIVAGAVAYGAPFVPVPGDELWVDGTFFATISKVAPGSLVNTLRVSLQAAISQNVGQYYYIVAKNLVEGDPANGITRPTPDMVLDLSGNISLKARQLRDITGAPVPGRAPVYISYSAVRQDVSPLASNPGLLRINDTLALEQALSPVSTANPLALGLFFALVNAPGIEVTGLGVDAVSADSPFGTVEAYTRAAEYLEAFEVYAIAPMTHDQTVAQVFNTHVNFMSEPSQKSERITLWNPEMPVREVDTLVASGVNGDALTNTTFDTKVMNLSALLQNAGVNPVGVIPVESGVFLDLAGDTLSYSVESINGGVVTLRQVFTAGTNEDGFYTTSPLTLPIIGTAFALRVRGSELLTPAGTMDKARVAETIANLGQSFQNRRFWMTVPDACAATIGGFEQRINGFYMNAAIAGMIGQQPPQQSFTNYPMTGFTQVFGSNDTFRGSHLNQMAGGGAYIIVQDVAGGPLSSRMALTTDLTSIETRTDSITKVVDFTAKFMRRGLRNFIGRFNITQGFLDTLGSVIQGLGGFLVETGVLIGLSLNNLIQDEDARDTVLVDMTLDPPYPCNYIRLTLVV